MNNTSATSATGGFLKLCDLPLEQTAQPQEQLDDVLHDLIAGISGLANELVRPRWQADPPKIPEPNVSWCAFGITQFEPHNFTEIRHHGTDNGHDELVDQEELQVLLSFYGPQQMFMARAFKRGIHVPQNRYLLRPAGLVFVKVGTILAVPELVAFGWRRRADLPLTFRLESRSIVNVLNIKKNDGRICSDTQTKASIVIGCQACLRCKY